MLNEMMSNLLNFLFGNILQSLTDTFADVLTNIMGVAVNVLQFEVVQNAITYSKLLAITLLGVKLMFEIFNTYMLYQQGDPDADPKGILTRTACSVAIIMSVDWIVLQIFTFGNKIASDIGTVNIGSIEWKDAIFVGMSSTLLVSIGSIALVIMLLVVGVQMMTRGAHLALMTFLAPIMAINVSSTNKSMWSAWFKEVIVICCSSALQIFLFKTMVALVTTEAISGMGILFVLGFMIAIIKTPKFIRQFMHASGAGQAGGAVMRSTTQAVSIVKNIAK